MLDRIVKKKIITYIVREFTINQLTGFYSNILVFSSVEPDTLVRLVIYATQ